MLRDRLRNHGARIIDDLTFRGFEAIVLENSLLRVMVLPELGSDIVEFRYKPLDLDVLWRAPNGFWSLEKPYPNDMSVRQNFLDYYPGGWQEILPNGDYASRYQGGSFPGSSETHFMPWRYEIVADEPDFVAVKFSVRLMRSPLYVEKTLSLGTGAALKIEETVHNLGREPFDLMWGHHPAFGAPFVDGSCVIDLPECQGWVHPAQRYPTQRLVPDARFAWPMAPGRDGSTIDMSRVQPQDAGTADMLFATDLSEPWFALTNQNLQVSLGFAWDLQTFPHLWLWNEAHGATGYPWYGDSYVLAIEPWSNFPGDVPEEILRRNMITIPAGEQRSTALTACMASGLDRVEAVTLGGEIRGTKV